MSESKKPKQTKQTKQEKERRGKKQPKRRPKKDQRGGKQSKKAQKVQETIKKGKTIWVGNPTAPFLDVYAKGKQLGEPGQFGVTFKCWKYVNAKNDNADNNVDEQKQPEIDKSEIYAVKHINKTRFYRIPEKYRSRFLTAMQDEINVLKTLKHQNIIKLYENMEDKQTLYLVMEICSGGELFARIVKRQYYNEEDAALVIKQLLQALQYMHEENNILHCDLKPDNIMFLNEKEDSLVKIIDFGMAKVLPRLKYLTHLCGTPYYTAPEIVGDRKYSYPVDMWSMGVILYVMVFGYPPFYVDPAQYGDRERQAIYQKIRNGFMPQVKNTATAGYGPWFPDHIPSSPEVRDLIGNLLQSDIKKRFTASEALGHVWITNGGKKQGSINPVMNPHILRQIAKFSNTNRFKLVVIKLFRKEFIRMRPVHFAQLEAVFQEMDKDGDGVVSYKEFEEAVVKVPEMNINKEHIKQMFQDLNVNTSDDNDDNDKDGDNDEKAPDLARKQTKGIVFGDLLNALVHGYLIDCDERLYSAFLELDEDNDRKITIDQLSEKLKEIDPLGEYDHAMELLKSPDQKFVGKDGVIDYEEFLLALHPSFEEKKRWIPESFSKMKSLQFSNPDDQNNANANANANDKADSGDKANKNAAQAQAAK